ncbi:Na+/H+ antiporter [Elizabethkingia anophelis]|uniref:Na+/H+ antiporter n=1 Tax=Elizabethkingia anophelis TaxID=1117645 RepID=UPI001369C302|nr:Na+/H+ antiporter [Elizabethkingia anophelis]MCT4122633.1 Na+/H+ antiporter [Elizabethkingia anophelis]MYY42693.1 Na+/H+ antiporter [Elizabethkingia anophelis]
MAELEKIIWISIILIVIISVKDRLKLALPILLVLAGLLLSLTQLIPSIDMSPEMIFYVVLPPILFDAAWNTSIPDFKKELPKISLLAVGLVFITTTIIAVVSHSIIPGFTWPLAFILGAIISPPDAVAATSITRDLPLPKKLITILEGESLLNDASALIAYKCAVTAVLSGVFSFWNAGVQFVSISLGGIVIGLLIGFIFLKVHRFLKGNSNTETFAVVLLPFATYSLAEHLDSSGVLAVVALGMFLSWNSFSLFSSVSRIQMSHFWDVIIFVLNGLVFLILGMQLPQIVADIPHSGLPVLILYGLLMFGILILIRLLITFTFPMFSRKKNGYKDVLLPRFRKEYIILSWSGMRGVVSLAAAQALPLYTNNDVLIEQRSTILFVSFVVIIFTLLIQGLTLPKLIKLIKPAPEEKQSEKELNILLIEKSLSCLQTMRPQNEMSQDIITTMTEKLKKEELELFGNNAENTDIMVKKEWRENYFRIELELIDFQRKELLKCYRKGEYELDEIRKKEQELDFWTTTVYHEIESLRA